MKNDGSLINKIGAFAAVFTMLLPGLVLRADGLTTGGFVTPETRTSAKPLSEEQKILHVLNRLGFGARPGDVDEELGVALLQQLHQLPEADFVVGGRSHVRGGGFAPAAAAFATTSP